MKSLTFIFLLLIGFNIKAQDIHFTNFQLAPMSLNPALAGDFEGNIRANGVYRDQNSSGYNTFAGGIEFNIPFAFRKQDWITIGAEYVNDNEKFVDGINSISLNQTNMALAYHYAFDKSFKNVLTAGIQYKIMSAKFNKFGDKTWTTLKNGNINPTIDGILELNDKSKGKSLKDWVGALSFKSRFRSKDFVSLGLSFAHILRVDKSIVSTSAAGRVDVMPARISGFVQSEIFINQSMSVQPIVYFQKQGNFSELSVQGLFGIEIDPSKNIKINPGIGYRLGDAVEFLFVMDYKKFKAGISFDLTTSKYRSSEGFQNGLEFGLSYTTSIIKKPRVKPVIFCPRL